MTQCIVVSDYYNNRLVKRLESDLSYVSQQGSPLILYTWGITFDGTYIYATSLDTNMVSKIRAGDFSLVASIGSQGIGNNQLNSAYGLCTDGIYLYIADTYNHRIVKKRCSNLSYVSKIGSEGTGDDEFQVPMTITTDGTYLYVLDSYNHRIVKRLCSDLSYDSQIGSYGSSDEQFDSPEGIACDGTYLYIADTYNQRVVKRLCSDLSFISKIGDFGGGSGNDGFLWPYGVACNGTHIFVADSQNYRIVKRLSSDLSYVSQVGSVGSGNDEFALPSSLIVGEMDTLLSGMFVRSGNTKNTIFWEPLGLPNLTYNIYWSTSSGVTKLTGTKITDIPIENYVHTDLINGINYFYIMTTYDEVNEVESDDSIEFSGKPFIPEVRTGYRIFFEKKREDDFTLPEFQDPITENITLTRGEVKGLYNIKIEESYDKYMSPENTLWAFEGYRGNPEDDDFSPYNFENLNFDVWKIAHNSSPPDIVDVRSIMWDTVDGILVEVRMLSWDEEDPSPGFSYERASKVPGVIKSPFPGIKSHIRF